MKQKIENFVNRTFNNFNIEYSVYAGELKNYKKTKLPAIAGIYVLYCDVLGVSYIGMTGSNVAKRFDKHIGRADRGSNYDKNNPHKVWDYFHSWCKESSYSLEKNSKYVFISINDDITKKQLELLENGVIFELKPLLNSECFEWFGYTRLEELRGNVPKTCEDY